MEEYTIQKKIPPRVNLVEPGSAIEQHLEARAASSDGLGLHDYIGSLGRFRHRHSGLLFTESALMNLHGDALASYKDPLAQLYNGRLGIRKFASLAFVPGAPENVLVDGQVHLNTWNPPDIAPVEGDPQPFLDIVALIFDGDEIAIEYFLDAVAAMLQTPGLKWSFMILIIGGQGVGKSMLAEMVAELVGRKNTAFPTIDAMRSPFSGWLLNAQLVVVHEMEGVTRDVAIKLKHWTTSETLLINQKNVPAFYIKNHANIIACSNDRAVSFIEPDDRRVFVWLSKAQKQPASFYADLAKWFFRGHGKSIVLNFLLQREISSFDPNSAPPSTLGKVAVLENNRSTLEHFLREAFDNRLSPFGRDLVAVTEAFIYLRSRYVDCTTSALTRFMHSVGAEPIGQRRVGEGERRNLWAIRQPERWKTATATEIGREYRSPFVQSDHL